MSNKFEFDQKERSELDSIIIYSNTDKKVMRDDIINRIERLIQSRQPEIVNEVGDDEIEMTALEFMVKTNRSTEDVTNAEMMERFTTMRTKSLKSQLTQLRTENERLMVDIERLKEFEFMYNGLNK